MFLKSLDLNGFKSFADKTHIDFADGITSLLGPNGCGKSNIVDAIKWVLGEQSTKTLRAGKMEDVIFNGTDKRKPLQFAEVTLTIDNSEHILQTDLAEIEIRRRVFRAGEGAGEYYINRQRCLLKNVKELFFDTGIGKSAYSILEQGKIDQILSSRPEDRRYIFEEAAGISRFKVECNEAQKKIERTDENILQVENLISVEKRSYTLLKNQAEKAMAYNELMKKQMELDVQLHALKLQTFTNLKQIREQQNEEHRRQLENLTASLEGYKSGIEEESAALREKNSYSFSIQNKINRAEAEINSKGDRIHILEEQYREYIRNKEDNESKLASLRGIIDRYKVELEQNLASVEDKKDVLDESLSHVRRAKATIEDDQKALSQAEEEVRTEEAAIIEAEGRITELSGQLKAVIEDLALELDEKMGEEYSHAKRSAGEADFREALATLRHRLEEKISFYSTVPEGVDIREKVRGDLDAILSSIDGLEGAFNIFRSTIPPFIDSLLAPEGLLTQKRKITEEEEVQRKAIEHSRARITQARERIASLNEDIEGLRETVSGMEVRIASMKAGIESAELVIQNIRRSIEENSVSLDDAESNVAYYTKRISETNDSIIQTDEEKKALNDSIAEMREELGDVMAEIGRLNNLINDREGAKNRTIETIQNIKSEIEKNEMWQQNSDEQAKALFTSFYNTYNRSLNEYQDVLESQDLPEQVLVENELAEVRKKIAALGPNINHMAVDDFKEAEERYNFYTKQLSDLNKAKADLEKVLAEIQEKSEQMFLETYKQISDNFQMMFKRLFNGGRAEITLEDEENVLTSGINIFAQPPGKKLINLTLLSGGERSMTAVALLFATYLVKPSPFCILDEIDAALDDRNIGYFLSVLEDFSQTSQFIIITHNTHTVMGSTSLLGVTQMEAGVSTTVTYKLANIAGEAVILDESDEKVEFDADGKRKTKS